MTIENNNAPESAGFTNLDATAEDTQNYKTFSWYQEGPGNSDEQLIEVTRDVSLGLGDVLGMIEASLMNEDDGLPGMLSKSVQMRLLRMAIASSSLLNMASSDRISQTNEIRRLQAKE